MGPRRSYLRGEENRSEVCGTERNPTKSLRQLYWLAMQMDLISCQ